MIRNSIVWKLNIVFVAVIVAVVGTSSYISNRNYERDAAVAARDAAQAQLETIVATLERLMMVRDNAGIQEVIDHAVESGHVDNTIRLIAHQGSVVAATNPGAGAVPQQAWPCAPCHSLDDPRQGLATGSYDRSTRLANGESGISVVTPVLNESRCGGADCHVSPDAQPVLGLLQADFSLREVGAIVSRRNRADLLTVLVAALLSIGATWLTMDRLLGRRMRALTTGMGKVAEGDLSVRFDDFGSDEVGELAGSFDDMTSELQTTLRELRSTSDYLWGIVENSADAIITVDPSGLIKTFNSGAEQTLGYHRDEVIGKEIEMLFAEPSERRYAIARLEDKDNVTNYETHFLARDGQVRDVILTLGRLRNPRGQSIGTFGISKDVTRENRMRRDLAKNERLAGIGQAVTGIQHSIKNMLSSLKGGAYMIDMGVEEHDRELTVEGWAMVKDGITHITELSSRMLHYVRGWYPELEETNIGDVVTSVYNGTREQALSKGIGSTLNIDPEIPTIVCDPRLVRLAVLDLAANAIDACTWKDYDEPERPEVNLRLRGSESEDYVQIEVEDNGEGMTEEIKKNLFTPFFSTKKRLGTGMGLALTERIIRRHGGTIEVESELGRGTTFKVSLPVGGPTEQEKELDA